MDDKARTVNVNWRVSWGALLVALVGTICMAIFIAPMGAVLMWSTILTILFASVNDRLTKRMGRNRAALITVVVILLTAIVPLAVVLVLVAGQFDILVSSWGDFTQQISGLLRSLFDGLPQAARVAAQDFIDSVGKGGAEASKVVVPALNATIAAGGNVAVVVGLGLSTLYVTFFFLRDWRELLGFMGRAVPLTAENKAILSRRISDAVSATVRGVILVAAIQSIAAGVIFWMLGVPIYAVLGVITFIGCFIPAIGSSLVWIPVALYFALTGDWTRAVVMILCGVFIISMVDNLLRPRMIAQKAALPDFLIFLSSIGGLSVAGLNGLFLGPIVAAFFVESWNVFFGLSRPPEVPAATD